MKFSTIMLVAAVTMAFVTTGCKYDKAGKGAGDDGAGKVTDISAAEDAALEGGNINSVAGEKRFEDMYARCTDVSFSPVYFGFDSSVIPQGEMGKADEVARHLKDRSERVVVIEGNCDERGSAEYNVTLGEERALTVRNYLVQSGISPARIQTRSYGEEKPAVEGHDPAAWAKNRRDEFAVYDTSKRR